MRTLNFNTEDDNLACQHCGEEGVQMFALNRLQKVRTEYGKPMIVTSAYRCANHPIEAAKEKPGTHNKGVAFDIAISSVEDRARLIKLAMQQGAMGIGIAKDFVHLDFDVNRPKVVMWVY